MHLNTRPSRWNNEFSAFTEAPVTVRSLWFFQDRLKISTCLQSITAVGDIYGKKDFFIKISIESNKAVYKLGEFSQLWPIYYYLFIFLRTRGTIVFGSGSRS